MTSCPSHCPLPAFAENKGRKQVVGCASVVGVGQSITYQASVRDETQTQASVGETVMYTVLPGKWRT